MIISEKPTAMLRQLIEEYHPSKMPITVLHAEHWRLSCLWSEYFAKYPMVIGPTWTNIPFEHDADLAADGAEVTTNTLEFITQITPSCRRVWSPKPMVKVFICGHHKMRWY